MALSVCQPLGKSPFFDPSDLAPVSVLEKKLNGSTRYVVARDGARIHYKVKGNPHATKTLVFLHGFAADSFDGLTVLRNNPYLKENYRILLVTLRGHGREERYSELGNLKPEDYYPAIVKDIDQIMEKEGIPSAIFMGHSMGGEISRVYYALHPKKVQALISISSFSRHPLKSSQKLRALKIGTVLRVAAYVTLRVPGLLRAFEIYRSLLMMGTLTDRGRWAFRYISQNILSVDIERNLFNEHYLEVALSTSFRAYLLGLESMGTSLNGKFKRPVTVPSLIIHGKDDKLVSLEEAELLKEQIPGAQLIICEGMHFPHHHPTKFPEIVNDFLRSLDAGGGPVLDSAC